VPKKKKKRKFFSFLCVLVFNYFYFFLDKRSKNSNFQILKDTLYSEEKIIVEEESINNKHSKK